MLYQALLRPTLFRCTAGDPEMAHEWVMQLLAAAGASPLPSVARTLGLPLHSPRLRRRLFRLTFPSPVGVAAGFDKNAVALQALAALGFGSIEAGTVTFRPQQGNPRPRVLRLPEHEALINRMGFNNDGALVVARRLARGGVPSIPVGISLGKSRATPIDDAVEDYRASFRLLAPHAGYIAVNVSSPNTPGLRALQERDAIDRLLTVLSAEAADLAVRGGRPAVPLLVKVAPDLTFDALDELLVVCMERGVAGVIAVNTTVSREYLSRRLPPLAGEREPNSTMVRQANRVAASRFEPVPVPGQDSPSLARGGGRGERFTGGLSGRPLFARALEVVRHIDRRTGGALPIIGVGGIFDAAGAYEMIRAGASLVQVYTGLIYEGPGIAHRINRGLLRLMDRDGARTIEDIHRLGTAARGRA